MKELEFYNDYIDYLEWQVKENKINKGEFSLLKISRSNYDKFIKNKDEKIENILKSYKREKVIKTIINEEKKTSAEVITSFDEIDDFFDGLEI